MCILADSFESRKTTCNYSSSEMDTDDDWVFIEKQPFTEPVWGKVVNKN